MKKNHVMTAASVLATVSFLGACSSPMPQQPVSSRSYPAVSSAPAYASNYGVVESIQMVNSAGSSAGSTGGSIGLGTVLGGVAGGVLGNQVGGGSGRTAATVAGTVGGAVIGNQIDKRNDTQSAMYQIGVRLDNGSYQTVTQEAVGDLSVGNRVRVENGRAYRY